LKVIYIGTQNASLGSNLKLGKEYIVYSVFIDKLDSENVLKYIIEDDQGGDILPYSANLFEIISSIMPPSWVFYQKRDSSYYILPSKWAYDDFWLNYYDGVDEAKENFISEKQKMFLFDLTDNEIDILVSKGEYKDVESLLKLLIKVNDLRTKKVSIEVVKSERLHNLWITAFQYLIGFKEEYINDLFCNFLTYYEKTKPEIAQIIYKYFEDN